MSGAVPLLLVFFCAALGLQSPGVAAVSRGLLTPSAPTFAGGTDVFGRTPRCRACHALLHNLQTSLVPRLEEQLKRDARRRATGAPQARRTDFGAYEALIQDELSRGCFVTSTYHDKDVRAACMQLLDAHEEELSEAFHRWVKAESGGNGSSWSWNYEMCHVATQGACPDDLARRPLSDFADDGSGGSDRTYRSAPVPAPGTRRDGILTAVAGNFHDLVAGDVQKDILVYVAYVTSSPEVHFSLWPSLVAATALLRGNATSALTFDVVYVDADNNDVPPPHDAGAAQPTVIMYAAQAKKLPRYIDRFQGGRLTVYDLLHFVALTASQGGTVNTAADLLRTAPREVLLARPWEDAESAWEELPSWAQGGEAGGQGEGGEEEEEEADTSEL